MIISEIPIPVSVFENMVSMAKNDLDELALDLQVKSSGKIVIRREVNMGTVATAISEYAYSNRPFVIVMGIHADNIVDRLMSDSVVHKLIRHHPFPVLVVPDNLEYSGIKKVGLACDLVNVSDTVPHQLLNDWLSVFQPSLDIVHMCKNEHEMAATAAGESVSLQNHFQKFSPAFHYLKGSGITKSMNEFVKGQKLDLLIVVPKKHGFFSFLEKRNSSEIIEHHPTAILAVHAL
jgi:hypothetical protein